MFHHLKKISPTDTTLSISFPITHSKSNKTTLFISHFSSSLVTSPSLHMFSQAHFNPKLSYYLDELSLSFIKSQSRMGNGRRRRRQQVMHRFSLFNIVAFVVLASVLPIFRILAEGRRTPSQLGLPQGMGEEETRIMRSQIGSRPPRCEGRCYSCGHCEAIQVPTNPQAAVAITKLARAGVPSTTTAYSRGDYGSNYKPMSWKCKCGNTIFNP